MAVRFPEPMHPPIDPIELEINQLFDHLIQCLNKRRVALLTTYRDTRHETAAIAKARARKEKKINQKKTKAEARLQINELKETQELKLAEIEQKLAEVRIPQPEKRVVFRCNGSHLAQVLLGVGEIVEEEVPVMPRYEDEEMRTTVAVGKGGLDPGELWNPNGVAIDESTNLIYVAEALDSCRISIFSETGEFMNTFTHKDLSLPHGIAIHRDNLYMTDRGVHAVFQFKIESDLRLVARLGSEGSGMGQFKTPFGLTVSTNGDVFIADSNNNRIQILDDSLHFQRFITHQTMKLPRDVKLTPEEVYVLCLSFPCILVFSHAGEKIRSLITYDSGMLISTANFFCLDRKQNFLISDWGSHQIRVFSKEGTHLHTIGSRGQDVGMFRNPKGIVLTKNRNLIVVSENYNYSLQIFSC